MLALREPRLGLLLLYFLLPRRHFFDKRLLPLRLSWIHADCIGYVQDVLQLLLLLLGFRFGELGRG